MFNQIRNEKMYDAIYKKLDEEETIPIETYYQTLDQWIKKDYIWSVPRLIEIKKNFSSKVRIVFNYNKVEMFILKAVNRYLWKTYRVFISNAYFPSRGRKPKQCLNYLIYKKGSKNGYGVHFDISNYFNSMDISKLYECLPDALKRDEQFNWLYDNTILNPMVNNKGRVIACENKGAMAGVPIAAFFAGMYLNNMDNYFTEKNIPYARYSDDIIVFAPDTQTLSQHAQVIKNHIEDAGLNVNWEKTEKCEPSKPWAFIGFECNGRTIQLSKHAMNKVKRRIGRWARSMRKKVEIRNYDKKKAIASLIRSINRALFKPIEDKYCWAQWVFPTINDIACLKELDTFIQEKLRFVYTGRYSKVNYNELTYEDLKQLGYHSLCKLYYKYKFDVNYYIQFIEEL